MSTFMANAQNVEHKWYIIDAKGKPLGRVASQVAHVLRGKHKVTFTNHVDTGDYVIVINCKDSVLTGKKLDQKMFRHHTGYVGGLKETPYRVIMAKRPQFAMYQAVKRMLPKNKLGKVMLKKLRVYADDKHDHEAQKPEIMEINI